MDYDPEDIESLLWSGATALLGERETLVGQNSLSILRTKITKLAVLFGLNKSEGQVSDPCTILNRCKAWMRIYETYQNKRVVAGSDDVGLCESCEGSGFRGPFGEDPCPCGANPATTNKRALGR